MSDIEKSREGAPFKLRLGGNVLPLELRHNLCKTPAPAELGRATRER
jgi:hypothetical protein